MQWFDGFTKAERMPADGATSPPLPVPVPAPGPSRCNCAITNAPSMKTFDWTLAVWAEFNSHTFASRLDSDTKRPGTEQTE